METYLDFDRACKDYRARGDDGAMIFHPAGPRTSIACWQVGSRAEVADRLDTEIVSVDEVTEAALEAGRLSQKTQTSESAPTLVRTPAGNTAERLAPDFAAEDPCDHRCSYCRKWLNIRRVTYGDPSPVNDKPLASYCSPECFDADQR